MLGGLGASLYLKAQSLRLLRALGDVASATAEPSYLAALRDHARRVGVGCTGSLPEGQRGAIEGRLAAVLQMTEAPLPGRGE